MQYKNIIKKLIKNVEKSDLKINLSYTQNIGNAFITYLEPITTIEIGAKELKSLFGSEMNDKLFVKMIKTIFHEEQHYYQQKQYLSKIGIIDEDTTNMYYNFLACLGCHWGYYDYNTNPVNYFNNPREIDAEYNGIKNAYNFISSIYGNTKTEKLFVDFINSNINKEYYINISKPVKNISEIGDLFQIAIDKSNMTKRIYNVNCIKDDGTMLYCQELNDEFVFKINEENNPVMQDKILAGAYVKYIEDKNIDEIIKESFLYKQNKNDLLATIDEILYKDIDKENDYEIIRRD